MKIQINQQEIESAIKYYIKDTYGININQADIELTATRGADGVIADIEINGVCGNSNHDSRNDETKETKEPQKETEPAKEAKSDVSNNTKVESTSKNDETNKQGQRTSSSSVSDTSSNGSSGTSNNAQVTGSLFGALTRPTNK